jgi:RND family efflux transporter MFP subunit
MKRRGTWFVAIVVIALAAVGGWRLFGPKAQDGAQAARKGSGAPIAVVTARADRRDVPVRLKANGTVTAVQSVDLRAQVTSTVREVHIREGQNVKQGDLLFSLDSRAEEASLKKALAQVEKDRADLATAQRNLARQRDLFQQKFISQSALDTAQNQVDTLSGQLAIDSAAVESARVARAYDDIRAPFTGRTGAISVRPGSLVQPGATATPLLTITQIDPITVAFTLPERELAGLQAALAAGPVQVAAVPQAGGQRHEGRIVFVDNAVDTTTGTIRVKAEFPNPKALLWPGMYVTAELSPRTMPASTVVPTQAVQTGPESRFVYVVGNDGKVDSRIVTVPYIEERFAVVSGLEPGTRVVIEGAQNLRPGATVTEAPVNGGAPPDAGDAPAKGKSKKAA